MFAKIYNFLLWFCGFAKGEKITFMLKRQKQRLGIWWWFLSLGTIGGLITLLIHVLGVI